MATKWPENGTTEEMSRDSAWHFKEIRHRSTSPMAQVGLPKVGAPPWCLRRSQRLPEKEDPVSDNEGEGVSGLRERKSREEKERSEILWLLSLSRFSLI